MECAWTVATDAAERQYKRYVLDFMHMLKFFESVTDQWVFDKTKNCDLPLSRLLKKTQKLNFTTT